MPESPSKRIHPFFCYDHRASAKETMELQELAAAFFHYAHAPAADSDPGTRDPHGDTTSNSFRLTIKPHSPLARFRKVMNCSSHRPKGPRSWRVAIRDLR